MLQKNVRQKRSRIGAVVIIMAVILGGAAGIRFWLNKQPALESTIIPPQEPSKAISKTDGQVAPDTKPSIRTIIKPIEPQPVIDINQLDENQQLKSIMEKRKAKYGITKGVDIIVQPDESLKIGNSTISMREILDKIKMEKGEVIEKDLTSKNQLQQDPRLKSIQPGQQKEKLENELKQSASSAENQDTGESDAYGVYLVKKNDNLWNVHFLLLKEYFDKKGITIESSADEPNKKGLSSGVGKLLKFSELMVFIFNIKEKRLSSNLNMIHPSSKIVVFNMREIFALLDKINYEKIDRIRFDGDTLWLPSES
jgi:hypothetical protein